MPFIQKTLARNVQNQLIFLANHRGICYSGIVTSNACHDDNSNNSCVRSI